MGIYRGHLNTHKCTPSASVNPREKTVVSSCMHVRYLFTICTLLSVFPPPVPRGSMTYPATAFLHDVSFPVLPYLHPPVIVSHTLPASLHSLLCDSSTVHSNNYPDISVGSHITAGSPHLLVPVLCVLNLVVLRVVHSICVERRSRLR